MSTEAKLVVTLSDKQKRKIQLSVVPGKAPITAIEMATLTLVAEGLNDREIAGQGPVSTVKNHVSTTLSKLGIQGGRKAFFEWLGQDMPADQSGVSGASGKS